ncbi:MAG: GxxExxY protein [Chlamydiales bacterium]|nr:GxxExxY protein [Chlamydiales bacterium]
MNFDNTLSYKIIGAAMEVHKILGGSGLLESIYEAALCHELRLQGLHVRSQVPVPVQYKGVIIRDPLVLDIVVENQIIVETKAVEKLNPIFEVQLLSYLRLTGLHLGLLINFGAKHLKDVIRRILNNTNC